MTERPVRALGLSEYLASFNIELLGTKPYAKGSMAVCESSIRLAKQALRSLCLANTSTWPDFLPIICSKINQMSLYNTSTRDSIFYSPFLFSNTLRLHNLDFPERLFHNHHDEFKSIIRLRENRLSNFRHHSLPTREYRLRPQSSLLSVKWWE